MKLCCLCYCINPHKKLETATVGINLQLCQDHVSAGLFHCSYNTSSLCFSLLSICFGGLCCSPVIKSPHPILQSINTSSSFIFSYFNLFFPPVTKPLYERKYLIVHILQMLLRTFDALLLFVLVPSYVINPKKVQKTTMFF